MLLNASPTLFVSPVSLLSAAFNTANCSSPSTSSPTVSFTFSSSAIFRRNISMYDEPSLRRSAYAVFAAPAKISSVLLIASAYCSYCCFLSCNDFTNGSSLSNSFSAFIAARSSERLFFNAKNGLRFSNSLRAFSNWSFMAFRSAGLNCVENVIFLLLMSSRSLFIVLVLSRERSLNN